MNAVFPFFSVIVPVYNVESYLRQCLDSVIHQDYSNYEVICINDGSTDDSSDILREYEQEDSRIKIIEQTNRGLSAARNAGIKAATGEYIFFLDSDDWIEPDTLKILAQKQNGEDMICFNGRRFFEDEQTEEPDKGIEEAALSGWDYYNKYALMPRKFHFVCTVLRIYRREFLLTNNLFFKEGIFHEDNLFTPIVCYYAKSVKVIPDCLYIYRIRAGSITQQYEPKRMFDLVEVANVLSAFFIPIKGIDKSVVYREIAGEYFKGFMPESVTLYGNNDSALKKAIHWHCFRKASIYPRHKIIYGLLFLSPRFFRLLISIEFRFR
jgi:glycosyltransferase involved in cell wall biosynthesis